MSTAGDPVMVMESGWPAAGSIVEVALGTVRISWSSQPTNGGGTAITRSGWFHDLEAGVKPGRMMGSHDDSVTYSKR